MWRAALGNPAERMVYGMRLATAGKHNAAVRQFISAARAGLAAGQCKLGHCYLEGRGIIPNLGAALRWFRRAALQGDPDAQTMLATLALQGARIDPLDQGSRLFDASAWRDGRSPDYIAALHWAERAASAGYAAAQALLGYILTSGPPERRNPARGAACYRSAAEAGNPHGKLGWALLLLADCNDAARARVLLAEAAAAGIAAAHYALGTLDDQPGATDTELAKAAEKYRAAAELGHRAAQFRYGLALLNGRGVPADPQAGETWLRRAALAGDMQAAALVGDLYAQTGPMPPNYYEAALWFRRAAEGGHASAARALGQLYLRGDGIGTDPEEAVRWLRVAAEAGDVEGAYALGLCLTRGVGTTPDNSEALDWLRRAATAGHLGAIQALAGVQT